MKITITGVGGEGKSTFVREVLLPALKSSDNEWSIRDGGEVIWRGKGGLPRVEVGVFNDPQEAAKWLGWKP